MKTASCNGEELSYTVQNPAKSEQIVLLLHGGSKTLGKDRFQYLQDKLANEDIASLAFDFSGVGDSSGNMRKSSLADRVEETLCIARIIHQEFPDKELVIYGVSMGGYIALAAVNQKSNIFDKLILHASAAYAEEAHSLNFDDEFTKVLNKDKSWKTSLSFRWLENTNKPVLFIVSENDSVIPHEITHKYKDIIESKSRAKFISFSDMQHNIWDKDESSSRLQVAQEMVVFIDQ